MVKFGEKLSANAIRGWREYYIDYERLKGILNDGGPTRPPQSSPSAGSGGGSAAEDVGTGRAKASKQRNVGASRSILSFFSDSEDGGVRRLHGDGEGLTWLLEDVVSGNYTTSDVAGASPPEPARSRAADDARAAAEPPGRYDQDGYNNAFLRALDEEVAKANGFYIRKQAQLLRRIELQDDQLREAGLLSDLHDDESSGVAGAPLPSADSLVIGAREESVPIAVGEGVSGVQLVGSAPDASGGGGDDSAEPLALASAAAAATGATDAAGAAGDSGDSGSGDASGGEGPPPRPQSSPVGAAVSSPVPVPRPGGHGGSAAATGGGWLYESAGGSAPREGSMRRAAGVASAQRLMANGASAATATTASPSSLGGFVTGASVGDSAAAGVGSYADSPAFAPGQAELRSAHPLLRRADSGLMHRMARHHTGVNLARRDTDQSFLRQARSVTSGGTPTDGDGAGDLPGDAVIAPGRRAQSRASLKRAIVEAYRELKMLTNFKVLNYTAVVKIVKKHDKLRPSHPLRSRVLEALHKLELHASTVTDECVAHVEYTFADAFCDGSTALAHMELMTKQGFHTDWAWFDTGLRSGLVLCLLVWVMWDCLVDTRLHEDSYAFEVLSAAFPIYRGFSAVVIGAWLWGLDLYVWSQARVNYQYIMDSDPRTALRYDKVWREATNLTIVMLVSFLLFYKELRGQGLGWLPAPVLPATFVLFVLYRLVFPWRYRKGLWVTIRNVVISPFGRVLFRETFAGDVLTSMVKPLTDLAYTVCFTLSGELFRVNTPGGPAGTGYCNTNERYALIVLPLMHALPLWFRFQQNLRRYRDTNERNPALLNALKYALAMVVSLFGVFHPAYNSGNWAAVRAFQIIWLGFFVGSTLYTFWWDVHKDWGLGDWSLEGKHRGLRSTLMYDHVWYYWAAIVADFILRFLWTLSLIPTRLLPDIVAHNGGVFLTPILAIAELCRRTMWAFIRVENEHLTNCEGFRRVGFVPMHFETAHLSVRKAEAEYERENTQRRRTALLEIAAFVVIVVSLSVVAAIGNSRDT